MDQGDKEPLPSVDPVEEETAGEDDDDYDDSDDDGSYLELSDLQYSDLSGNQSEDDGNAADSDWALDLDGLFTVDIDTSPFPRLADMQVPSNPLLIPDVLDHIFGFLEFPDLMSCYEVCQIWRQVTPLYMNRSLPPIVIENDTYDAATRAYLTSMWKDPNLKASKLKLVNTDLSSSVVQEILKEHRENIREIEISYIHHTSDEHPPKSVGLKELLTSKAPNLQALIVGPLSLNFCHQFLTEGDGDSLSNLKRIQMKLGRPQGYGLGFLKELFRICPQVEEFEIKQETPEMFRFTRNVGRVLQELSETNCLHRIKTLKMDCVDHDLLEQLNSQMNRGQLQRLEIGVLKTGVGVAARNTIMVLGRFLTHQCSSLMLVDIDRSASGGNFPGPELGSVTLVVPSMPNLVSLKLPQHIVPKAQAGACLPKLRVHSVRNAQISLTKFMFAINLNLEDQITSPGPVFRRTNVQILQGTNGIPIDMDSSILERIGRLAPNLTTIRLLVSLSQEPLLTSIWKFYPCIAELFLTLDSDAQRFNPKTGQVMEEGNSLDSIFSGIPEVKCKELRGFQSRPPRPEEKEMTTFDFDQWRDGPSICDLKKLNRLYIGGPSRVWLKVQDDRVDKLSNIFGYSVLSTAPSELTFFQVNLGLVRLSQPCVQHICKEMNLERVTGDEWGRLIKPGLGYHTLGANLPHEWLGGKED